MSTRPWPPPRARRGDWEGGTRIAESLHAFNRDWARRVLARGAVVLLITDGLDRDGAEGRIWDARHSAFG